MNRCLLLLLLVTNCLHAQQYTVTRNIAPYDSAKKDWSCLDRLYMVSKLIHPHSLLYPHNDSLAVRIDVASGELDSSYIDTRRDNAFKAIAFAAPIKDSMVFNTILLELCSEPTDCRKAFYSVKKQNLPVLTFEDWLSAMTAPMYWPTGVMLITNYDQTNTILFLHEIDIYDQYFSPMVVKTFSGYIDNMVGDKVFKSSAAVRKKYTKLKHLFYHGDRLLGYSESELNGKAFPGLYGYSFWISFQKNYEIIQ